MQLLQEAEQAWRKIATQTRGTGTTALANALRQSGYEAQACMAIGGGGGAACLQNLCHRFVSCSVQGRLALHIQSGFMLCMP